MASITLFQDYNYGGSSIDIYGDISNLDDQDFNDEASSCKIDEGVWILYTDSDFQGQSSVLGRGSYETPEAMGIPNDSLSSLRSLHLRPHAPVPMIFLFEDSNYGGRMVVLTFPVNDLREVGFNDQTSSIIVLHGTWNLYQDSNSGGTMWTVSANGGPNKDGRYPQPDPFQNDSLSSLEPA